jgi:hypothetical protein
MLDWTSHQVEYVGWSYASVCLVLYHSKLETILRFIETSFIWLPLETILRAGQC